MKVLVTGAAGHLGEALALALAARGDEAIGFDLLPGRAVSHRGSICERGLADELMAGIEAVFHTATLHKPHVASHGRQAFIDVNVTGTDTLLEAAFRARVGAFVFTSTTSVFSESMKPGPGAPAVWVDESLPPAPRNIYGVTKLAAEGLCAVARREEGLNTIVLRTSRFFPEPDDEPAMRAAYAPDNLKLNEFLHRRADIEDIVSAHLLAAARVAEAGPGPYIVSATTPFSRADAAGLARDAPAVVARDTPGFAAIYDRLGWRMYPTIGRVYDNARAREVLGWRPKHDFASMLERVASGGDPSSDLALEIGAKGYHASDQAKDSVIAE